MTAMMAIRAIITWLVHLGIWMLLVSTLSIRDFAIGVVAASLTTIFVMRTAGQMKVKFHPTARHWAEIWRIPWYMLSGTFEILQALGKQLFTKEGAPSFVATVPFDCGGDDSQSAGRRALAVTYTTLTPNFVIFGIVERTATSPDLLLYHQVIPGEVLQMTQNLGARP
ncbi:MAG: hypothetical protein JO353_03505 [Phycisphaerae bacterium]|nr:hypothetical protein [Phycisphaerae bacterium]